MKTYNQSGFLITIAILWLLYSSCSSVTYAPLSQNLASIYKKQPGALFPEFTLYHATKDSSRLYFLLKTNELSINTNREKPSVSYKLQYVIYRSFEKNEVLDSNTIHYYNEDISDKATYIQHFISLYTGNIKLAVLRLKISDVAENSISAETFIAINREDINNRQYFKTTAKGIAIGDNVHEARYIDIKPFDENYTSLHMNFYSRNFTIAEPPYYFDKPEPFNYKPDSTFLLQPHQSLNITRQGFYHIQMDTSTRQGCTLYKFYEGFPNINNSNTLLEPLRYITTENEYEDIQRKPDRKAAVDAFWLTIGNDEVRTRELIKKFYTRVMNANKLFTSYKEGWKTDRGMIFIVYGTPNIVYKTENSESWIYGEEGHVLSMNFTFVKVTNPFSDNDFQLNRAPMYQNNWYTAIDHWRDGRPGN